MRPAGEILALDGPARRFAALSDRRHSAPTRAVLSRATRFSRCPARATTARASSTKPARRARRSSLDRAMSKGADIEVDDVRLALAHAAANFYPGQPETIVAVTGTSGKTSVASFARQIFADARPRGRFARHHRRRVARAQYLRLADDAQTRSPCTSCSLSWRRTTSRIWRWRPPRTGSTRSASTACV